MARDACKKCGTAFDEENTIRKPYTWNGEKRWSRGCRECRRRYAHDAWEENRAEKIATAKKCSKCGTSRAYLDDAGVCVYVRECARRIVGVKACTRCGSDRSQVTAAGVCRSRGYCDRRVERRTLTRAA